MAKQKHYIFNQLTQSFEVLETSKAKTLLRYTLISLAVLGAAFLSKEALQKICDAFTEEDFYLDSHKKIFNVLKELNSEGVPVDITIVTDRLESSKELSSVGNIEYLVEIANFVPSAANIDYYINIVHDKSVLRRLIEV